MKFWKHFSCVAVTLINVIRNFNCNINKEQILVRSRD